MKMKLATWNVNSLRVRLPALLAWLERQHPTVVCLQETKLVDESFPVEALAAAGYRSTFAGQKTYNGVAILSHQEAPPATEVQVNLPGFADEQKRLIAATVGEVRVACAYIPNGQSVESDKYTYKLNWLEALLGWLGEETKRHPNLVLAGDFNIAPTDADVYDPALWAGKVLCSAPERAAFERMLALGLRDSFRLFEQAERSYSWWDYREMAFRRKRGLRIDHILVTEPMARQCESCSIDIEPRRQEQPSDHAPVWASFNLPDPAPGSSG